MVDAVSPLTPFSRVNKTQSSTTESDATNRVQSSPSEGVEVILTQAERTVEELTYENLRPNRSAQRAADSSQISENPVDQALQEDALDPDRV
jgi:hypothetical protein